YNGDGRPDILITNGQHGIRLWENTGAAPGWFRDVSDRAGLGPKGLGVGNGDFVAFADVNGDGYTDVFYNLGKGILARSDGEGKFVPDARSGLLLTGGENDKRGVAFADFDRDGDLDVFVPDPERARLYRNTGDGTFTDVLDAAGDLAADREQTFSAAWGDVNSDGAMDLFVCHPGAASRLYLGDGTGKFTDATERLCPGGFPVCFTASFADVDGDGDLDLLLNASDRAVLYLNELDVAEDRSALLVDVRAAKGVTGAVVRVLDEAGRPVGLRELTGAEGCGGQPPPAAHFGVKRGGTVTVSVGLSDGRLAQKRVTVDDPVVRVVLRDTDFK
ncbi:MAG TPA: VCBS repeat-containing protein, partial [Planctomycetota bacterium]|nr:VCBS repeat-containing protein [Planctomycetota bacterium]